MKLNPPYLNNKLPAFTLEDGKITIPFELSRSVNINDVTKYSLLIREVSADAEKSLLYSTNLPIHIEDNKYEIEFIFNPAEYIIGYHYKVQLRLDSIDEEGYLSNTGIIKCIEKPTICINNLNAENINGASRKYTGTYTIKSDITEKVSEYCFEIIDNNGLVYDTSGWLIHNTQLDTASNSSEDTWETEKSLEPGIEYSIIYKIKTTNNYETETQVYKIINQQVVNFEADLELHSELDRDNGCVNLFITCGSPLSGKYLITRASSLNDYMTWNQIADFEAAAANEEQLKWKDNTIEHGIQYLYAIQAYNDNNIYSKRQNAIEGIIQAEFEDMFLSDGERTLKVKFNPTVSSFKTTVLEQKVDPMGSKFPFFYRNGSVNYKEFSVSGLISILMDEGLEEEEIRTRTKGIPLNKKLFDKNTTNLIDDNIYKERKFKMSVLEWLNNGKSKLFRSPTEGSYIIRLMNISLSPNDTLGRMLHTFSSTAYEIADNTWSNIIKNKIFFNNKEKKFSYSIKTSKIYNNDIADMYVKIAEADVIKQITFYNIPNSTIEVRFYNDTPQFYAVGAAGVYTLTNLINVNEFVITTPNESSWYEVVYKTNIFNKFDKINSVTVVDNFKQISNNNEGKNVNVLDSLGDINYVYYLKITDSNQTSTVLEESMALNSGEITLNGETISLANKELILRDLEQIDELLIGFGVTVEIAYQEVIITKESE